MPNIKSAEKRVSVSATKKLQNQKIRSQMQTAIKKFNAAISEGNVELAKQLLPVTSSKIDNAAVKNVIHKNAANRKKAQIARTLSQLEKGVIVVKVDAKTLKQAEQKAAAARKAEEAQAIKAQRNEAKKAKEAAKAPATTKKSSKKATAKEETAAAPKKRATKKAAPVETPAEGEEIQ
ncbi:MAG TPA: 30S ribosomal protein S20 [Candidatus Fimimonas gallinarum]|uniref:Small ribosomal subunit protein bS20 n=1 Tax=Candidatus Fimimonas gallinarum TaxID=2840821 RepID=A0A9D1J8A7_9BACT|nr:30S ribosomal protein S20 [Candidatus Fimimonas gallinarum]